jgi:pimeloyl-ACP methyl ester carboxylesterase
MPLAYERHGSGPALILIHGLGHRRQGWDVLLPLLTPHREVITFDLPGHGQSHPLELNGTDPVTAVAAEIAKLLRELGLDRPHIAGNSLGGALALVLAANGHAASATALSPAGFATRPYQMRYAHAVFNSSRLAATVIAPLVPSLSRSPGGRALLYGVMVSRPGKVAPEQARGDVENFTRTGAAIRAFFHAPPTFTGSVDVPVTIAWGDKDRVLPPSNAIVARRRLPNARIVTLPGCGHVPMTDNPELVSRVILEGSGDQPGRSGLSRRQTTPMPVPADGGFSIWQRPTIVKPSLRGIPSLASFSSSWMISTCSMPGSSNAASVSALAAAVASPRRT